MGMTVGKRKQKATKQFMVEGSLLLNRMLFALKVTTEGLRLTRILGLGKKPCYMKFVLVGL